MIESILIRDEGKTLEFKENCRSLLKIVRTAVAFANTAGGSIVIGVQDKTKQVVGLSDVLKEEERLANAFAHGILPQSVPDIEIHSWRGRELIVITVPHAVGPYYVASEGPDKGVYIRLGSTNRRAGPEIIAQIRSLASNTPFDEQPCPEINSEAIDFRAASELFVNWSRTGFLLKLAQAPEILAKNTYSKTNIRYGNVHTPESVAGEEDVSDNTMTVTVEVKERE